MYAAMRRYYYWVRMAADVVSHVRACDSCAMAHVRSLHRRNSVQLFPATMPFQDAATDQFRLLDKTAVGSEYIIVITDMLAKMVPVIPMGRVHAIDSSSVFVDYWIAAYGPPHRILSDRGSQFTARFWEQVFNLLSVEREITTPSRPQTNGQTERFNRILGRTLDALRSGTSQVFGRARRSPDPGLQ